MKFPFEFVSCCGSPGKKGERIQEEAPPEGEEEGRRWTRRRRRKRRRGAAAEWKPSLCAISEDVVVVTVDRVGGGGRERRKKAAADSDSEPERSASRKRSGSSGARVHDRGFNGDVYDQRWRLLIYVPSSLCHHTHTSNSTDLIDLDEQMLRFCSFGRTRHWHIRRASFEAVIPAFSPTPFMF